MSRRRVLLIFLAAGIMLVLVAVPVREDFSEYFLIEGIYDEAYGTVTVRYLDYTNGTDRVTIEILGMRESFHRTHDSSKFVEVVEFSDRPRYGWDVHPITLVIYHEDLGTVTAKTEIRDAGDPAPPIIFGR